MRKITARDSNRDAFTLLEQLPNIGYALADDLRLLGIQSPKDLLGRDPVTMYEELAKVTGQPQDPCVLDTFIAIVQFMTGEPATPWWKYTAERKRMMAQRSKSK